MYLKMDVGQTLGNLRNFAQLEEGFNFMLGQRYRTFALARRQRGSGLNGVDFPLHASAGLGRAHFLRYPALQDERSRTESGNISRVRWRQPSRLGQCSRQAEGLKVHIQAAV